MGPDESSFPGLTLSKTVSHLSGTPRTRGARATIFQVEKLSQCLCGWCLLHGWFEGLCGQPQNSGDSVVPCQKTVSVNILDDVAKAEA